MLTSSFDKEPHVEVHEFDHAAFAGYERIGHELRRAAIARRQARTVIVVECYPGVLDDEVLNELKSELRPGHVFLARDANFDNDRIQRMIDRNLTDDRVFGVLSHHKMSEFFDPAKISALRQSIERIQDGIVLVYGTGAMQVCDPDIFVYADLARWEIQLRYRQRKIANWCAENYGEDFLRMYKRGFFVDWRVADREKIRLLDRIDYLLDTNIADSPRMVAGEAFRAGLRQAVTRPFRLVPYFDAGPWGGQWMKRVCDLDGSAPNYAWCFHGVPEENSLYLKFGDVRVEVPSIDLVFFQPRALLGEKVYARFGTEFPIRFDFLDTMDGGNLSLQVHPTTEYIQSEFGIHYTQDESYYVLDAGRDACVYLGVKNDLDKEAMFAELHRAQAGETAFDAEKHVNRLPAHKHDHYLIPAGTVHASGANSMVLEISATPYIFTFKLWDWGRLGLDGRPRPVHLEHGRNVLNSRFSTDEIRRRHVNHFEAVAEGDGWREERTGLHESGFLETRRHWFTGVTPHNTHDGVNVINVVEGREVIVESPSGAFQPFVVHYAETFIVPAAVGVYTIRPHGPSCGERCATVRAFIRT